MNVRSDDKLVLFYKGNWCSRTTTTYNGRFSFRFQQFFLIITYLHALRLSF